MTGYLRWPLRGSRSSRLELRCGPGTTSYSMPCSSSAFWTFQHGWPPILTHMFGQRWSLTGGMARPYRSPLAEATVLAADSNDARGSARNADVRVAVGAGDGASAAERDAVVALDRTHARGERVERAGAGVAGARALVFAPDRDRVQQRAEEVGIGVVDVPAHEGEPPPPRRKGARDPEPERAGDVRAADDLEVEARAHAPAGV